MICVFFGGLSSFFRSVKILIGHYHIGSKVVLVCTLGTISTNFQINLEKQIKENKNFYAKRNYDLCFFILL